jgi:hypothetical protein
VLPQHGGARRVSEADACLWLGRHIAVISRDERRAATGILEHVSRRGAFVLQDGCESATGRERIRLVPLRVIARIVAADRSEATRS